MTNQTKAYIGLGSNLGSRRDNISKAVEKLDKNNHIQLLRRSSVIETKPLQMNSNKLFLNTVVEINTALSAQNLLETLQKTERELGRDSKGQKKDRTIDIDILLFGEQIINDNKLTVPHKKMHLRSFALQGLCELCGDLQHPLLKCTLDELLKRLNGNNYEFTENQPNIVSIAGIIGVGKTTLTDLLCKASGGEAVYECYDENPFLAEVYDGNRQLALDSQLFFLISRIKQLRAKQLNKNKLYICDYVFEKEMLYAKKFLNKYQLELYKNIHFMTAAKITEPKLVIYLADNAQNCLQKIRKRGRAYEQNINVDFLNEFCFSYDNLFENWNKCPVITVKVDKQDTAETEFVKNLADQIDYYIQ
jgi:2-amino-4-hydroxy-6-hydroxymethyldihydropteridine diphosphokinase